MNKSIIFLTSLVMFSGCVNKKNVSVPEMTINSMKGKSLVITTGKKPSFTARTAGKAAFGMLGAAAMISKGNEIIKENNVEDPALYIGSKLGDDLSSKRGLNVDPKVKVEKSDEINTLAKKYKSNNYVLDVRTIGWSFEYFPTDWNNYRTNYSTKLRLIDTENSKLVAEGFCAQVPEQTEQSPSYDQLLADNAKALKSELSIAANKCVNEFKKNIFHLK